MAAGSSKSLRDLWEEAAHLKIQISVLSDQQRPDVRGLQSARARLVMVEERIRAQKTADAAQEKNEAKLRAEERDADVA